MITIFSVACSPSNEPSAVLDYRIEKFDLENNAMDVVFTVTNNTSIDFVENKWSLHWNQILGEPLQESLPDGIDFERVNGNSYLILRFGDSWQLRAGESISFSAVTTGLMNRLPLGPRGAFVVTPSQTIDLQTNIDWQKAEGLDGLNLPTAKDRYQNLANIKNIPTDSIAWVVPSPKFSSTPQSERKRLTNWNVYINGKAESDEFDSLLKAPFEKIVSTLFPAVVIDWVESDEGANVILNHREDIAPEEYHL
ncbi:MAG: hypothetical protein ACPHYB_01310, partial [Flavobacteriaceae bacterium]